MAKRAPIELGGIAYPTQKAAGDFVRTLLHGEPLNTPLVGNAHIVLLDLLQRHPDASEKVGAGVKHFEVRENSAQFVKVTKGFWIVRLDGSEIDFSYLICLKGQSRSLEEQFALSCRDAVRGDIQLFKQTYFAENEDEEGFVVCPISGELILWEWAHVDHGPPLPFDMIVKEFLESLRLEGFVLDDATFSKDGEHLYTTFADLAMAQRFRLYHNTRCQQSGNLRLVSQTVNLTQKRKPGRAEN